MRNGLDTGRHHPYLAILLLGMIALGAAAPPGPAGVNVKLNANDPWPWKSEPTTSPLETQVPEVSYTPEQVEDILKRAADVWRAYRRLRPELRVGDRHEQGFASRAAAVRARLKATARVMDDARDHATRENQETAAIAIHALARATAVVERDLDRILLRFAQRGLFPPDQSFTLCAAPAFARIPPTPPTRCSPLDRVALTMAQGEAESFQLVVVPFWTDLKNVRLEIGKIYRREGIDRFEPEQVRFWLVQSIATSTTTGAEYSPDPLTPFRPFDLPAAYSQSILIDVRARKNQPPGVYEGKITVASEKQEPLAVSLQILVRSFALPEGRLLVSFRAVNEALRGALSMPKSSRTVETWNQFLAPYHLEVHTPSEGVVARLWLEGNVSPLMADAVDDIYAFDAPTALAHRAAGWTAWDKRPAAAEPWPWLVRGWVSVDSFEPTPEGSGGAPRVRNVWPGSRAGHAPGMVYLNRTGEPDPTLRLVALRDGIEDFAYLDSLADLLDRATRRKAVGWWTRRRCRKLLKVDSDLVDPERIALGDASDLLKRREKVAKAIEQLRDRLRKDLPNP